MGEGVRAGRLIALGTAAAALLLGGSWMHQRRLDAALLRTAPSRVLDDPALRRHALSIARGQYAGHCAGCHGPQFEGDRRRGVPDLAAGFWLYTDDPVDVEHTILYGIRSGHPKARNVTDMPAMVRSGQITAGDAHDVVEYLQSLAGKAP